MSGGSSEPRVMIVDAFPVERRALNLMLRDSGIPVVAEAPSPELALQAIERLPPTNLVVLVAIEMPEGGDPFRLMRAIRDRRPTVRILAHGSNTDPLVVSRALFSGGDGFLDHAAEAAEFVAGVRDVLGGQVVLVGLPAHALGSVLRGVEDHHRNATLLTPREVEVLTAAGHGLTARQIGALLGLRERTVTTHLTRIYAKLGTTGRSAAVAVAIRAGLIRLDGPRPATGAMAPPRASRLVAGR